PLLPQSPQRSPRRPPPPRARPQPRCRLFPTQDTTRRPASPVKSSRLPREVLRSVDFDGHHQNGGRQRARSVLSQERSRKRLPCPRKDGNNPDDQQAGRIDLHTPAPHWYATSPRRIRPSRRNSAP